MTETKRQVLLIFLIVSIVSLSLSAPEAFSIDGAPTGWGWCAICGADRGPGHDFTHGAGSGSGGGGSGWGFFAPPPPGPSPEEIARQWRSQQSTEANDKGVEYAERGDYDTAIKYYEQALDYDPNNQVARDNLQKSMAKKANLR